MENIIDTLIKKIKNDEIDKEELLNYLKVVSWRIEELKDTLERFENYCKEDYKKSKEPINYAEQLTYRTAKDFTFNYFNRMEVE